VVSRAVGVADDQEAVDMQKGMIQRIGHQADRPERIRTDARRVKIELDGDRELRELAELLGERLAVDAARAGRILDALRRQLAQLRGADAGRRRFDALQAVDQLGRTEPDLPRRAPWCTSYLAGPG